ncbi:hypothetical protein ACFSTH_11860 [Paenibacillus yanchengensis]|uniref:Uncharacterized protein n=1 Tax=Paenibacillus yanchengensis TaxID=2035833 RepID=A0ABW4YK89_9BACL
MDSNSKFKQTRLLSLLYDRRRKIDRIVYLNSNSNFSGYVSDIIKEFKSIPFDDLNLEQKLKQTEIKLNLMLDRDYKDFTEDEIQKTKEISVQLKNKIEDFSKYKEDREKRVF